MLFIALITRIVFNKIDCISHYARVQIIIPAKFFSETDDASSSETDQLFADVKEEIKEIRSDWYSLAIELDIDYDTRKVRLLRTPPPAPSQLMGFLD